MAKTNKVTLDSSIRHAINKHAVDAGFAPDTAILARMTHSTVEEVERALDRLAANRGLVLHPNSHRIWVAHPFSFAPTSFWVSSAERSWWANCAWCALGIAAMLDEGETTISSRHGAEGDPVEIHVSGRAIREPDVLVHFAVPMSKWWDNVHYTCSTILFFRSIRDVDSWCARHAIARGEVISIDAVWALAQAWYGDYLNPNWRRRTNREAREIFEQIGLRAAFWQPADGWDS